uniref:ADP-ribosyl cyclase/cyclic ADP-ribose hydrolase n=1 Tax=Strongyloides venezuelensis TaxID=75913 RepID=A0A0K0F3I3_STRVS
MNILLILIVFIPLIASKVYTTNRCTDLYNYCPSWYSTITFILSEETNEEEWNKIKFKTNQIYDNCTTEDINMKFFAKNAAKGSCLGPQDCMMLLNNLTLNDVKPNITYNNFWNDLIHLYTKNYNSSSGLAGYIITNIECDSWSGTAMESLINSSKIIYNGIQEYNVIFNILQIMDDKANRKCDFAGILKEPSTSMNIMTVDYDNLQSVNASLYGLCSGGYNQYKLDNWPEEIVCTSNENDFKNCKNWTYAFYIALSSDSTDDTVDKTKELLYKLTDPCSIPGSHVYLWTSETTNKGIPCDPSLGTNCKEAIDGLCLYDMLYSNKSVRQLDIESMKVARWSMNNPIGEGIALYIISNLKEDEFYNSQIADVFLKDSWNQGYFYYTNHVVARFLDIGKVIEKRNNTKSLLTIKNASNLYFDVVSVDDLDDLISKSSNMTVCKAKYVKKNSSISVNISLTNSLFFIILSFCYLKVVY